MCNCLDFCIHNKQFLSVNITYKYGLNIKCREYRNRKFHHFSFVYPVYMFILLQENSLFSKKNLGWFNIYHQMLFNHWFFCIGKINAILFENNFHVHHDLKRWRVRFLNYLMVHVVRVGHQYHYFCQNSSHITSKSCLSHAQKDL